MTISKSGVKFDWDNYEEIPAEKSEEAELEKEKEFSWDDYGENEIPVEEYQTTLIDRFIQGATQESASGKLGQLAGMEQQDVEPSESMAESLVTSAGGIAGDMPFMKIGGYLGASIGAMGGGAIGSALPFVGTVSGGAIGGAIGGASGAWALPAFLKEAISQYQEYQNAGNDITFGEFIERAGTVGSETLKQGAFGAILGTIGKAMPALNKIPMFKKMFNSKYIPKVAEKVAQKGADIGVSGAAMTTVPALAQGRLPTGEEFAENLILAAGFEAVGMPKKYIKQLKELYKNRAGPTKSFWSSKNVKELKQKLIEEGLPETSRKSQEAALESLIEGEVTQQTRETPTSDVKGIKPQAIPTAEKSLTGRNIQEKQKQPFLPKQEPATTDLKSRRISDRTERLNSESREVRKKINDTGAIFSKGAFVSDVQAGTQIKERVQREYKVSEKKKNQLYKIAEEAYEGVEGTAPELVTALEKTKEKVSKSLSKSPGEEKVNKVIDDLIGQLKDVAYMKDGSAVDLGPNAYKTVSASSLIKTANSISSTLKYETTEPDVSSFLKPIVREVDNAATKMVEKTNKSSSKIKKADAFFAQHANKFYNKETKPYLTKRSVNPEEVAAFSRKEKQHRALEETLPKTIRSEHLLDKIGRDIVEAKLKPYHIDPKKVGNTDYVQDIKNLKASFPKKANRIDKIDRYLRKSAEIQAGKELTAAQKKLAQTKKPTAGLPIPKGKITHKKQLTTAQKKLAEARKPDVGLPIAKGRVTYKEPTKLVEAISKWSGKTPEDIATSMNSRSGIRELKEDLSKKRNGTALFEALKKEKLRDIFEQGNINKDSTAKDIHKAANNRKNYEIIEELIGKKEAKSLLAETKRLSDKRYTREMVQEHILKLAKRAVTGYLIYDVIHKLMRGKNEDH